MTAPVATLTLPDGRTAALSPRGRWESDDAVLRDRLNERYSPGSFGGVEAVLPAGHFAVTEAARGLGATHDLPPVEPLPPGVIS